MNHLTRMALQQAASDLREAKKKHCEARVKDGKSDLESCGLAVLGDRLIDSAIEWINAVDSSEEDEEE